MNSNMEYIDKLLATVPHSPGCYLMKDINGDVFF